MHQNFNQYLRSLQILHFTLLMGLLLVSLVLNFNVGTSSNEEPTQDTFLYIIWALWLCALAAALTLGSSRVNASRENVDLTSKLEAYRSASIFRLALVEGSAMVCIVIYFFMKPYPSLPMMVLINWLLMASFYFSKQRILDTIQPNMEELELINDENATVFISTK